MISSEAREMMEAEGVITWNDCDDALIGTATRCGMETVAVYDYDKLVQCFLTDECDEECAHEWVEFNIVGAYVGPQTPMIFYPLEGL